MKYESTISQAGLIDACSAFQFPFDEHLAFVVMSLISSLLLGMTLLCDNRVNRRRTSELVQEGTEYWNWAWNLNSIKLSCQAMVKHSMMTPSRSWMQMKRLSLTLK